MSTRCVILWARFGPYHLARLNAAAKSLAEQGLALTGLEVASSDDIYDWDEVAGDHAFDRRTLFPGSRYEDHDAKTITRRVTDLLQDLKPAAVGINGWAAVEAVAALNWCRRNGSRAILFSESRFDDMPRKWWRERVKSWRVGKFDGALVGGRPHRDYLVRLGFRDDLISFGYDVVDNAYFAREAAAAKARDVELRQQFGLPQRYFFACTRFIGRKNVDGLLKAYAEYRTAGGGDPWGLVIAGGGEELTALKTLEGQLELDGVQWPGFVQYGDLPTYYGLAGGFIHPALSEPWGLVVNEAAASGLPVLSSSAVGAAAELVCDGENGFLFDPADVKAMARAMARLAGQSDGALAAMGEASRKIVADWSPARFASGFLGAMRAN